jgi:hypothetical protein
MEKLRNSLRNDVVRGRQSTMYRAQRLAEYALYDGDPSLVDTELDQYLAITADEIKEAAARYLDVENRVLLDIIPAGAEEESEPVAASPLPAGEAKQPAAPAPQIPPSEPVETPVTADVVIGESDKLEPPQQPSDLPKQTDTGSGPLHT